MALKNNTYKKHLTIANMLWLVFFVGLTIMTIAAVKYKKSLSINQVHVNINVSEGSKSLITEEQILNKLRNYQGYDLEKANMEELDLQAYERILKRSKLIKNVEVYLDGKKDLYIDITQNEPIVRILSENMEDYYLDKEGKRMPVSQTSTIRVPVATGFLPVFNEEYLTEDQHTIKDIYNTAKLISQDKFLSALIEQIYVDEKSEITLIPKIGREKILLGYSDDLDRKLENLKIFYKEGLTKEGWNKFKYLDLKYEDLVFAGT